MTQVQENNRSGSRWLRFSLRAMLVFVMLCTIPFAWYGYRWREAQAEKAAIAWVEEHGGAIYYHDDQSIFTRWLPSTVRRVSLENIAADEYLGPLASFNDLELLFIQHAGDVDLAPLANLENLRHLNLNYSQITDLEPIAGLVRLEELHLEYTPVSDLSPLANLKSLRELHIGNSQVTDLTPLTGLEKLDRLFMDSIAVTDLSPLHNLKKLRGVVMLGPSDITLEEAERAREAMPDCAFFGLITPDELPVESER